MSAELWIEKYRPKTLDEYVWKDTEQRRKVEEWLAAGALPHLLLSGVSGTGKTSLAKLLMTLLGIPSADVLVIHASRERKIDELQERIVNFAGTWSLNPTGFKYVIMDEADSLSFLSQKFLRTEMEAYEASCRFIMTCNYPEKIMPAIVGRMQQMHFQALIKDDFIVRAAEVLVKEDVGFEYEDLTAFADRYYPDLRKTLGELQYHTNVIETGEKVLSPMPVGTAQTDGKEYLLEVVNMFVEGKYLEGRKMLVEKAQVEEYVGIYQYFYRNLDLWGDMRAQDDALLIIARGLRNHTMAADPEINLAATICELVRLVSG